MAKFTVGDKVSFTNKQNELLSATVIRLNKKTVSLATDDSERWNVAPGLLQLESPLSDDIINNQTSTRKDSLLREIYRRCIETVTSDKRQH